MSGLLCTARDRLVLETLVRERVLRRSEVRRRFFAGVSRQMADRRILVLLKRFPEIMREERLGFGRESVLLAHAIPGAASTYREHDEVLNCLRDALVRMWPQSIWLPEIAIRTGEACVVAPKLGVLDQLRIPDAVWLPGGTDSALLGIEYERTLKSRKRVLEVVRAFENRARSPLAPVLVFCATQVIASAYTGQITAFYESLKSNAIPRTKVIALADIEYSVGSASWNEAVAARVTPLVTPFTQTEIHHGKAS